MWPWLDQWDNKWKKSPKTRKYFEEGIWKMMNDMETKTSFQLGTQGMVGGQEGHGRTEVG